MPTIHKGNANYRLIGELDMLCRRTIANAVAVLHEQGGFADTDVATA